MAEFDEDCGGRNREVAIQWSRIPGGEQLVRWFEDSPVCFHDSEISDIWHGSSTNARAKPETFSAPWSRGSESIASRCVIAIYLYRFGDCWKKGVVELDFRNVRSFELVSDFPQQIVLDEIVLEEKEDAIRVTFIGITGFGGHIEAEALTVRMQDVAPLSAE